MGLLAVSDGSREAPVRKPKFALRLRLNNAASPARLGFAQSGRSASPRRREPGCGFRSDIRAEASPGTPKRRLAVPGVLVMPAGRPDSAGWRERMCQRWVVKRPADAHQLGCFLGRAIAALRRDICQGE